MQELIDKINELNKLIETLTHDRDEAQKENEKLYRELWNIDNGIFSLNIINLILVHQISKFIYF